MESCVDSIILNVGRKSHGVKMGTTRRSVGFQLPQREWDGR